MLSREKRPTFSYFLFCTPAQFSRREPRHSPLREPARPPPRTLTPRKEPSMNRSRKTAKISPSELPDLSESSSRRALATDRATHQRNLRGSQSTVPSRFSAAPTTQDRLRNSFGRTLLIWQSLRRVNMGPSPRAGLPGDRIQRMSDDTVEENPGQVRLSWHA
jgi:hypothetical protein